MRSCFSIQLRSANLGDVLPVTAHGLQIGYVVGEMPFKPRLRGHADGMRAAVRPTASICFSFTICSMRCWATRLSVV